MKAFRLLLIKLRLASTVNLLVLLLPGLWAPLRSLGREGWQEGSCWHSLPQATRHTELLEFPPPGCSQKRIHTATRRHCSEKRIQMSAQLISEIWQQQQWKHATTFPQLCLASLPLPSFPAGPAVPRTGLILWPMQLEALLMIQGPEDRTTGWGLP